MNMLAARALARPAAMLRRMARQSRTQSIEQAASELLAALLSADDPPSSMLEAGHALVDGMDKAGLLDQPAATLHAQLAARRPRVTSSPSSTSEHADDAPSAIEQRRSTLDALLALQRLTPQQVRDARMLIMGLELAGKLDKAAADNMLRSILDRAQAHPAT